MFHSLKFYQNHPQQNRKGKEKGRVDLKTVKVVETVEPDISSLANLTVPCDLKNSSALQIVYNPSHQCNDGAGDLTLCIFTPTQQERDSWLWNIRLGMG